MVIKENKVPEFVYQIVGIFDKYLAKNDMTLAPVENKADFAGAFCTSLKMYPATPKPDSFSKTLCDKRKLDGSMGIDGGAGMKILRGEFFKAIAAPVEFSLRYGEGEIDVHIAALVGLGNAMKLGQCKKGISGDNLISVNRELQDTIYKWTKDGMRERGVCRTTHGVWKR